MVSNEINEKISNRLIKRRAKEKWDAKSKSEKLHCGYKYRHIFIKYKLPTNDWSNCFSKLTRQQRNILIKGELIRTYDALSNNDKTIIKKTFGLSRFASKWFKLSFKDKKILLNSVLYNG